MLSTTLEQITLDDLRRLVVDQIPEGKAIEYKQSFYQLDSDNPDFAKRQYEELLKDISSFANTIGGDLIIGVAEAGGVPINVCGIETADPDALKRRVLEIVQNGLEPRIGLAIHAIPHSTGRFAFVIRVPRSLTGPHRVVFRKEFGQFWSRNSAGAFKMDTGELRQAFTLSDTLIGRIKSFHDERVQEIRAGRTPIVLPGDSKLLCHLVPLESFSAQLSFEPASFEHLLVHLPMLHQTGGWSHRFNLDGMVTMDSADTTLPSSGYVQVYRSGVMESVADDILFYLDESNRNHPLFKTDYVREIIQVFPTYLRFLRTLGVPPPVWCFFTLLGVRNATIRPVGNFIRLGAPIDRDALYLPEFEIRDLEITRCEKLLRPVFDALWNSAGFPRCSLYNAQGDFTGRG